VKSRIIFSFLFTVTMAMHRLIQSDSDEDAVFSIIPVHGSGGMGYNSWATAEKGEAE